MFYIPSALHVHVKFYNSVFLKASGGPVVISDNGHLCRSKLDRYQINGIYCALLVYFSDVLTCLISVILTIFKIGAWGSVVVKALRY